MKSKIIIFCLILCLIFSISTVSATELNETDNQAISISQENTLGITQDNVSNTLGVYSNDEEVLTAGNSDSGSVLKATNDDTTGSFADLENLIKLSSGTIILQQNYEYKGTTDTKGITIDKSITIDGNGYTINGNSQSYAFKVTQDNVTIKNINIINGYSAHYNTESYAGAVYWLGDNGKLINTNISKCTINTGDYATSGGIAWWGANGEITQVDITSCRDSSGDRRGAALSCAGLNLKISNLNIHDNYNMGGYACVAVLGSSSNVSFYNSNFTNCFSGGYGVVFYEATSGLSFEKCNFDDTRGNLIFCRNSDITYTDCNFYCHNKYFSLQALHYATFKNCTFHQFTRISDSTTNSVSNRMRDNSYINCTFIECNQIYLPYSDSVDSYINVTFINCTNMFTYYPTTGVGYVIIENCTFDNSTTGNTVIHIKNGQKNIIINNKFINIPESINYDITIDNGAGSFINNTGARILNQGNNISYLKELYVNETGTGNGSSWSNACNLTFALTNIVKDGTIHVKKGTYDLKESTYNINFILDNENNVIITNGSLLIKNSYNIKNLIFKNLTNYIWMGFYTTITNCTFNNITFTPIYLSYTTKVYNLTFKHVNTTGDLFTHYTHGLNSLTVDGVNITDSKFGYFITSKVGCNSIFKNINITRSSLTGLYAILNSQVYKDINNLEFSNINISNSNITLHIYSNSKPIMTRKVIFNNIVINNTNNTGYAHLFNGVYNAEFNGIKLININNSRKDIYAFRYDSAYGGASYKNIEIVNFTNSLDYLVFDNGVDLDGFILNNVTSGSFFSGDFSDVTLSGLIFIDTNFTSNKIMTLNQGSKIISSTFDNYTGHILVNGSGVKIQDSEFKNGNNSLLNGSAFEVLGTGSYFTLENVNFTSNTGLYGGAVYVHNGANRIVLRNVNFTDNNATGTELDPEYTYGTNNSMGGAVKFEHVVGSGYVVTIDDFTNSTVNHTSRYYNNIAGNLTSLVGDYVYVVLDYPNWRAPGATANSTGNARSRQNAGTFETAFSIAGDGCTIIFVNQSETYDYSTLYGAQRSDMLMPDNIPGFVMSDNLVFLGNNTTLKHIRFHVPDYITGLTAYNITYADNPKGAVIVDGENVLFKNCAFIDNGGDSAGYGAAILVNGNNTSILDCNFTGNRAYNASAGFGGALYINASNIQVSNSLFTNNSVADNGGHIYINNGQNITIIDSVFVNASQLIYGVNSGSGVVVQGSVISVVNNTFVNNTAGVGSALSVIGDIALVNILDNNFTSNNADNGALYLSFTNSLAASNSISGNIFSNNSGVNGGALFVDAMAMRGLTMNNNYTGNNATRGGAVFVNASGITLSNDLFKANNATEGGALYVNASNVVVNDAEFIGNNATFGGAAYVNVNGTVFNDCNFTGNVANVTDVSFGSAVYVADYTDVTIKNSYFNRNYVAGEYAGNRADISYDGILPTISSDIFLGSDPYQQYAHNRSSVKIWYNMVYVSMEDRGQGYSNATATTMTKALDGILPGGVIVICDEDYMFTSETFEQLRNANLTNVTIVGLDSKSGIKRNTSISSEYLFILILYIHQ